MENPRRTMGCGTGAMAPIGSGDHRLHTAILTSLSSQPRASSHAAAVSWPPAPTNCATASTALAERVPELARTLLGEPSRTRGDEWRYGSKGSLAIVVRGVERGVWFSHEAGVGGDALGLVAHVLGIGIAQARRWALEWLGAGACALAGRRGVPRIAHDSQLAPSKGRTRAGSHNLAECLWVEAISIHGTPAEHYLRQARCIDLGEWPADLRFHPRCPRGQERLPALLAAMRDPVTGKRIGIQRTFLSTDGHDRLRDPMGKAMLGSAGVVMLSPPADVTHGLHLAEGVESTLSGLAFGLAPAWAAISAGGLAQFPVLPGVECLTILADADDTGLRAAATCAARWRAAGREVRVMPPIRSGADYNDLLRECPE